MRQVLGIAVRSDNGSTPDDRRRILDASVTRARAMLGWTLPVRPAGVRESVWSDGRHLALMGWQNELDEPAGAFTWGREDAQAWLLGYTGRQDDVESVLDADDLLGTTAGWSGCFGVLRAGRDRIEAVTDATRSGPFYRVETPTVRMIGTRATQLHLLAQAEQQATDDPLPVWDLLAMRHMAGAGYVLGDRTPYADVTATPLRSVVSITPDRTVVRTSPPETVPVEPQDARAWADTVDAVAGALVDAFDPIPVSHLRVGVTGGRDSRMIAAALSHRAELDVRTYTVGDLSAPDVVIGRQVAEALGFPHEVEPPAGTLPNGEFEAEDILVRTARVLDWSDGMTSAWDDSLPYGPYQHAAQMSGVGGEIIRGGRNVTGVDTASPERAAKVVLASMVTGKIFQPAIDAAAKEYAAPLLDLARTDPYRALDDFYFFHRNNRWVSSRRTAVRLTIGAYDPMLDHRVVGLVRSVPAETRWLEHLAFDVVERLAPALRDLPIQGSRWRFERTGPSPRSRPDVAAHWTDRVALEGFDVEARTTWKRLPTPELRATMNAFILDRLDDSVTPLIDRRAAVRHVTSETTPLRRIWHLATALVQMQVPWYKTTRPPSPLG